MSSRLFSGLRIVDLTGPDAYDCGRLFALLGAEVVRVDSPASARLMVLPSGEGTPEWRVGNAGKSCHVIDYIGAEGASVLRQLLHDADVLVHSFSTAELRRLGLDYDSLASLNNGLVLLSITVFGQQGPYAEYKGRELIASAMGTAMSACGDIDRPPVREPGNANFFHACAAGVLGAAIALHERRLSGRGQHVDISAQEMGFNRNSANLVVQQFDGVQVQRAGAAFGGGLGVWPVRDGYIAFNFMGGKFGAPANAALSRWMDEVGVDNPLRGVDWDRWFPYSAPAEQRARWNHAVGQFLVRFTRAEIVEQALARGFTGTPLYDPVEALDHVQLQARGFVAQPFTLAGRPVRQPRYLLKTTVDDDEPVSVPWAPGCDGSGRPTLTPGPPVNARVQGPAGQLPLRDLKVLDFCWAIVGNTLTKQLADFGATVVKIETAKRLGLERLATTTKGSKATNPDDKPWFAQIATSKQSLQLDLTVPAARPVIEDLVRWADVVVENFSPGTMDRLGLGYGALKALNPDVVMASGSVYGQTGPMAKGWGVDSTGSALSGRMLLTGWPDRSPGIPAIPYGDCLLPYALAAAVVGAVDYRDRTGEGCYIDGSMFECLMQQMLPVAVTAQLSGVAPQRVGNRHPLAAPHGVFACQGTERWIAIEVFDERSWRQLCQVLGQPQLADDPRFTSNVMRKQHEDALEAAISALTAAWNEYELMRQLQAVGIAAGVVQYPGDAIERDPQLRARNFLVELEHPVLGRFEHQTPAIKLSRTPYRVKPAPLLGQHTREVLRQILGYSEETIGALERSATFV